MAFVGVRLVSGVRFPRSAGGRTLTRRIVGNIHWRHLWPVPLVLRSGGRRRGVTGYR